MARAKYNLVYPPRLTATGKLETSHSNNKSRIRFLLRFIPGTRPWKWDYGTYFHQIEQSSNPRVAYPVVEKLRRVLFKYFSRYMFFEGVSLDMSRSEQRILKIEIQHREK
jgi:hypothetical protein